MTSARAVWRCVGYEGDDRGLRPVQPGLSVQHAFARFGAETLLTSDPAEVLRADALVLPGVGAFRDGMAGLEKLGLIEPIRQKAAAGTPAAGYLPWYADAV